jgi:hypothetical protein
MKPVSLAVLLVMAGHWAVAQSLWARADSLMSTGKWAAVKHFFVPNEVRQDTLLFVIISRDSAQRESAWMDEQAKSKETMAKLVGVHFWGGEGQRARMAKAKQAYGAKSRKVEPNSLILFDPNLYPFAVFHYAEVLQVHPGKHSYSLSSRQGYFVLDRKRNITYPMFSPGSTRRLRKFFRAICQ